MRNPSPSSPKFGPRPISRPSSTAREAIRVWASKPSSLRTSVGPNRIPLYSAYRPISNSSKGPSPSSTAPPNNPASSKAPRLETRALLVFLLRGPGESSLRTRRFPSSAIGCLRCRRRTMDGNEFVTRLKAENEAILAKIDEPPIASGTPKGELLATLIKMALKNEIEAAEIAAEWDSTTHEVHAKQALARHAPSGCTVRAELSTAAETQQAARRAALGLLETGDRVRSNALQSTGVPVIPGC